MAGLDTGYYADCLLGDPGPPYPLGLWGNVLALRLFGMTDAVVLGAKVAWFFWWTVGMIQALFLVCQRSFLEASTPAPEDWPSAPV